MEMLQALEGFLVIGTPRLCSQLSHGLALKRAGRLFSPFMNNRDFSGILLFNNALSLSDEIL